MDSSEDRVRLLMKETIEFLRSHAFIFNFSNIKMVKDKILDQVPSGTFRGIKFCLYQSCDAFVSEDACMLNRVFFQCFSLNSNVFMLFRQFTWQNCQKNVEEKTPDVKFLLNLPSTLQYNVSDWKNFMKTTDLLTFKECFYEGSSVATSSLAPQTFVTFVRERNRLMDLVDRETLESSQESDDLHNNPKLTKGMCPKKHHEVSRMTRFLASRRSSSGPDVVVDVGSGLGYLGRSLTQAGFRLGH